MMFKRTKSKHKTSAKGAKISFEYPRGLLLKILG